MKEEVNNEGVPEQESGAILTNEQRVTFDTEQEAAGFYALVKERLLNVNNWQQLTGDVFAQFQLSDAKGQPLSRTAQKGDLFKIDIPGPGAPAGESYDWVEIEDMGEISETDYQSDYIRVRPTKNPDNPEGDIAHFFDPQSTSTFKIERKQTTVSATVYDRNIKPNTDVDSITDKIRNAVIGGSGALGLAGLQWQAFVDGLVKQ